MKLSRLFLISEVLAWQNNILYAFDGSNLTFYNEKEQGFNDHPDAFPHLDFIGRECSFGPSKWKPKARAWGRIDTIYNNFHIVTQHGVQLYDGHDDRELIRDIENRLAVLDEMVKQFSDYKVHVGGTSTLDPISSALPEHFMTIPQYREYLMRQFPS